MVAKKSTSITQCVLTDDEYNEITLEIERIDYLADMGKKTSDDPGAVECATSLIQERTDIIGELLSRAFKRAKEGVAHGE